MNCLVCRVVSQTESSSVTTQNGELDKCYIRVKEIGSDYANEYICSVLGNLAQCRFQPGDKVIVTLRFQIFENNGKAYQEVRATEIIKV